MNDCQAQQRLFALQRILLHVRGDHAGFGACCTLLLAFVARRSARCDCSTAAPSRVSDYVDAAPSCTASGPGAANLPWPSGRAAFQRGRCRGEAKTKEPRGAAAAATAAATAADVQARGRLPRLPRLPLAASAQQLVSCPCLAPSLPSSLRGREVLGLGLVGGAALLCDASAQGRAVRVVYVSSLCAAFSLSVRRESVVH